MQPVSDSIRLAQRSRPGEPPVMYQSWKQLLFLHWRYEPAEIQHLLPEGLTVDTFEGSAWVGVVPFAMRNVRPAWAPTTPYLSHFLELNLRTYAVNAEGVPGVWFFSLDASRLIAVGVARAWFRLPYFWAKMASVVGSDGFIDYRSQRRFASQQQATLFRYRPQGDPFSAQPGTLEFFLAERYILFSRMGNGGLATGQVHHPPYPLRAVRVDRYDEHLLRLGGLSAPGRAFDHALYSDGVDVDLFALKPPRDARS